MSNAASPPPRRTTSIARTVALLLAGGAFVALVGAVVLVARASSGTPASGPAVTTTASTVRPTSVRPAPTTAAPAADPALAGAQQSLKKLGYYTGPVDGIDSSATRAALTEFQTWAVKQPFGSSVTVTGRFDPPTQYALNVALGGNADGPGSNG